MVVWGYDTCMFNYTYTSNNRFERDYEWNNITSFYLFIILERLFCIQFSNTVSIDEKVVTFHVSWTYIKKIFQDTCSTT